MGRSGSSARWISALGIAALAACAESSDRDRDRDRAEPAHSPGSDPAAAPSGSSDPSPEPAPRDVLCTAQATRYVAYLATGSCRDVPGAEGTWLSQRLFPDAPPTIRDQACGFRWTTSAAPDVAALGGLGAELLTPQCVEPASLAVSTLTPGTATEVPSDPGGVSAPTGVSGCDVCGRLALRDVFVVLPADKRNLERIVVGLDTGKFVSFDLAPSVVGSQAFFVTLPAPPAGATYVEGRVPFVDTL